MNKENRKMILTSIGLFLLYFILQLRFANDNWFPSDEFDVMLGGKALARGFDLYSEFLSQHMPISYYVSYVFELLGAHTVVAQRICYYALFSLCWVLIYVRGKAYLDHRILLIYPIIFMCILPTHEYGTVILSEHLVGIGFVALLLEYYIFCINRKISLLSCLIIMISVLLTFGTTFVSIFGLAVIGLAVMGKELMWKRENNQSMKVFFVESIKKYGKLLAVVSVPWIILVVVYAKKHILKTFIFSAYTLNRQIYPKYLGYGSSIIASLLKSVDYIGSTISKCFDITSININSIVILIFTVFIIKAVIFIYRTKGWYQGVVITLLLLSLGTREYYHFHGTQFLAVAAAIIAYYMIEYYVKEKKCFKEGAERYQTVVPILALVYIAPFISGFSTIGNVDTSKTPNLTAMLLEEFTESDEPIWHIALNNEVFMIADRTPVLAAGAVPWMWEGLHESVMEDIQANPPRALIYSEGLNVWGYCIDDYAPELVEYINNTYTRYNPDAILYLRNDYYNEVVK